MGTGQDLYREAKRLIPGGTQLLSKRPEMFLPELWPAYYDRAEGCRVWDLDGNEYMDASFMGLGACILGYSDVDVDRAVKSAVDKGSMATLNCPEEIELAKMLCDIHPWADMVRYSRSGGEAMAIAIRIARAHTSRDVVLFCGYHGWHDWYLSANLADDRALDGHLIPGLAPKGVPRPLKGTALPFEYNDIEKFHELVRKHRGNIAAVVMEPIRGSDPKVGFLETIREVTRQEGIVMIFDEITAGWRLTQGGAHLVFGIEPDMAVFAKGISNGYPMAAILGRASVMDAAQETFISSTYWTERIGPAATIATIKKLKDKSVPEHLVKTGRRVQQGWEDLARKHDLSIKVGGIYPLGHFSFEHDKPMEMKTLFVQEMLEKGFLATNAFYVSYAHKEEHVKDYLDAVDGVFAFLARAKEDPKKHLKSAVCHSGFKRLA